MKLPFGWTTNRRLAAAALALGLLATAGSPLRGTVVTLDTQELATIVESEVDHVTATDLADWLVTGRSDYRLIDLRDEAAFAAYHIPESENVPLTRLPEYGLGRNEKIVLVSEGGIHSAQAWMLMRARKYVGVYMLSGGIQAWKDEVLFPVQPASPTNEQAAAFAKAAQVARHFGGQPRAAIAAGAPGGSMELTIMTPAPPAAGAAGAAGPRKAPPPAAKKQKEGC